MSQTPAPPDATEGRLRAGRIYLLMLLSPFTFFVTAGAALLMALQADKSGEPVQRRHRSFQLRVLLGAAAWIAAAAVQLALPRSQVLAAMACLLAGAVWCAGGSLIGLRRLMAEPAG